MSDMELVIKIPQKVYKAIRDKNVLGCYIDDIKNIIRNGTPLPKGHGRLIDVGQCDKKLFYEQCGGEDSLITAKSAFDMLMSLPTIVEANKKESEDKE